MATSLYWCEESELFLLTAGWLFGAMLQNWEHLLWLDSVNYGGIKSQEDGGLLVGWWVAYGMVGCL